MSEYKRSTSRDDKGRLLLYGEEVYGNDQNVYNAISELEEFQDIGSPAEFSELAKAKAAGQLTKVVMCRNCIFRKTINNESCCGILGDEQGEEIFVTDEFYCANGKEAEAALKQNGGS